MADIKTINQAIADYDDIEAAIEEMGVDVPVGTDTKEYGKLIRQANAENEQKAYKSGEDNGIAEFWDAILADQYHGRERFAYTRLTEKIFTPPRTIKPIGTDYKMMFYYCKLKNDVGWIDCVALEKELGYPVFDFSGQTNSESMFAWCDAFSHLGVIDISKCAITYMMFYYCTVKYIEKIIVSSATTFSNTFRYFSNIEHCSFEGVIAQNGVDFTYSTKLDKESLVSVINCLADKTADTSGTIWKVTFGATNLAKLTDEEKAEIEAKGWTYA